MAEILITDLTTSIVGGTGVFDKLMTATKAHLESEYDKGRIKGPEYATVYLGALDNVMSNSLQFLLQKAQIGLQADLLTQQIILAQIEVQKAEIALQMLEIEKLKVTAEVAQVQAQTALTVQQQANLSAEMANIPKQGAMLDQQVLLATQQVVNMAAELPKIIAEVAEMESRAELTAQQVTNMAAEALNIPKQGTLLDKQAAVATQQLTNLASENAGILNKNTNTIAEGLNIPKQGEVLDAQVCKLQAEFDLTVNTTTKTTGEIALLTQKTATERAQVLALGVDPDSVVGKQKALYQAQTDGFARDAEQKAAKLLVDTWSARRMSDEGTVADGVNMLQDSTIGRAVNKVLAGVGA